MRKIHKIFCLILLFIIVISSSACDSSDSNLNNNETHITKPIEEITLDVSSKAIELGESITIEAEVFPVDTDDSIVWSSTNEDVLIVKNGVVKAIGVGTAGISVKAKNGKISKSVAFKVMHKSNGQSDINKCKTLSDSATLTITNKCYNTSLGVTTKSETKTFTATIFKQSGTTYYFITGYDNFKKIDGYDYQEWTAKDCNGKRYEINSLQHEDDFPHGNDFRMAIGSINAYNLGVLPVSSRGYYYKDERLYIKDSTTFKTTYMNETVATYSPVAVRVEYKESLYGSPVLDSDFNFVGFVIRKDPFTGYADFVATWKMNEFIKSCGIA